MSDVRARLGAPAKRRSSVSRSMSCKCCFCILDCTASSVSALRLMLSRTWSTCALPCVLSESSVSEVSGAKRISCSCGSAATRGARQDVSSGT
eukprot:7128658-Prymnesium_polylepis.1